MDYDLLSWLAVALAGIPAILYIWNSWLFQLPRPIKSGEVPEPSISVLIPARNEENSIAACLESVLGSKSVRLEVVVLDDHSIDRTAAIVREIAAKDDRLRLEIAPALPNGWCGKQHACSILATHARFEKMTFLDADVRLSPDALVQMSRFLDRSQAGLVSGFPRQETETILEQLIIPLINWLLLSYLPLIGMRYSRWSAFAAGCGQWFMTTRKAYDAIGGHAAIKTSLHDGITLPRAYRLKGFHTDILDATTLARCRMYRSAGEVWFGFAKNAREGLAGNISIFVWTILLLGSTWLPVTLLAICLVLGWNPTLSLVALLLSYCGRLLATIRFRSSILGLILHPIGVGLLVAIQWFALYRSIVGKPVGWKGRTHPTLPSI